MINVNILVSKLQYDEVLIDGSVRVPKGCKNWLHRTVCKA